MRRFEALVHIDDLRQLEIKLVNPPPATPLRASLSALKARSTKPSDSGRTVVCRSKPTLSEMMRQ